MRTSRLLTIASLTIVFSFFASCGKKKSGDPANLPLVKPPVQEATPEGLLTGSTSLTASGMAEEIKSRFFTAGPTFIMGILQKIDDEINDMNSHSANTDTPCVNQAPVAYTVTVFGQPVTMYASCYDKLGDGSSLNPDFWQVGVKDGVTYLYFTAFANRIMAIVTPASGAAGKYHVKGWLGMGYENMPGGVTNCPNGNKWDSCSYGAIEIDADSSADKFEIASAGIGFGFYGVQLKSDGINMYAKGSWANNPDGQVVVDLCMKASDATTAATCTDAQKQFTLPPIGTKAAQGANGHPASQYPDPPNITLDGTSTDSIHFGPLVPADGASAVPWSS